MQNAVKILVMFFGVGVLCECEGTSIEKAKMLNAHGLRDEAKKELIGVIFGKSAAEDKAEAYFILGNIAFTEKNISAAIETWTTLVEKYPNSNHVHFIKDKIQQLAEHTEGLIDETNDNVTARYYLKNAEFWSKDRSKIFRIDTSWIPNFEPAIKWYDKIIEEFPKTASAERAYKEKLFTILGEFPKTTSAERANQEELLKIWGWEETGLPSGVFSKYMPLLLDTFQSLEEDFPQSNALQRFRFQIAQVYWKNKKWMQTREWLNRIINAPGDTDSFFKDLARRRLEKVEY